MKKMLSVIIASIMLFNLGCGGGGGSGDEGSQSVDPVQQNEIAVLSYEKLAGPDGSFLFQGEEYMEDIEVPINSLVFVWKDGEAFIYHPLLGDTELSSETSIYAIIEYFDFYEAELSAFDNFSTNLEIAENRRVSLKTGIDLESNELFSSTQPYYSITAYNKARRWAALKLRNKNEIEKVYLIPPRNHFYDLNVIRLLKRYFSEDFWDTSSETFIRDVNSRGFVESFGASVFWSTKAKKVSDVAEAESKDAKLLITVNKIDFWYSLLETLRTTANTIPFECWDLTCNCIFGLIEPHLIEHLKGEMEFDEAKLKKDLLVEEVTLPFFNCIFEALLAGGGPATGTASWWGLKGYEVVQTIVDSFATLLYLAEEFAFAGFDKVAYETYDSVLLTGENPDLSCYWNSYQKPEFCPPTPLDENDWGVVDTNDNDNDSTYVYCQYYNEDYGELNNDTIQYETPYVGGLVHGRMKWYWEGKLADVNLYQNGDLINYCEELNLPPIY